VFRPRPASRAHHRQPSVTDTCGFSNSIDRYGTTVDERIVDLIADSEAEYSTSRPDAADSRATNADSSYDDGSWSQCRHVARSLVGTPNYIAPEVLSQSGLVAIVGPMHRRRVDSIADVPCKLSQWIRGSPAVRHFSRIKPKTVVRSCVGLYGPYEREN